MASFGQTSSGGKWPCLCLLLLVLSSSLLSVVSAQITHPSNSTEDLPPPNYMFKGEHFRKRPINLIPLTPPLVDSSQFDAARFKIRGTLRNVDPANAGSLQDRDIAFLSCDRSAYSGNLGANDTLATLITASRPAAILLYSTGSKNCRYTTNPDAPEFENIFTLLEPDRAMWVREELSSSGDGGVDANVFSDLSGTPTDGVEHAGSGRDSAMIILYSITGIITALFLGIIITGAIRAHRHPERYGPRTGAGLPRQSRARGLARAMLETIPIVKFGDQEDSNKQLSGKLDVEMTAGHGDDANDSRSSINQNSTSDNAVHGGLYERGTAEPPKENDTANEPPSGTAISTGSKPGPDAEGSHIGSLGCSICTDDFVKGQDIRVLPCNHKFHPECVDPWLVNVSGTCPLCRIDLNPPLSEHQDPAQGETESGSDHPEPADATAREDHHTTHPHRRGLSSYIHDTLNARRMRDASVEERIATLRRLRREQQDNVDTGTPAESSQTSNRRSHRLSSRLRDSLRIGTRPHGDDSTPAPTSTG